MPFSLSSFSGSSFSGEGIVPGQFVSLTGENIGPEKPLTGQLNSSGSLPTTLGGTSITFDGIPAQLLSVSANRVVCVIPFGIDTTYFHIVNMQLTSAFGTANPVRLGELKAHVTVTAVVNPDGSPNNESTPAKPGSVLTVYAVGLGQTRSPTMEGLSTAATPRTFVAGDAAATVDGKPIPIAYIGSAPGQLTAVTQVNLQIPTGLASGQHQLSIGVGPSSGTLAFFVAP